MAQSTVSLENKMSLRSELPTPRGAMLRSLVLPGWGHQYVDKSNWTRGKIHMAADVVMILSYLGLNTRINQLEGNLNTLVQSKAGTSLKGKGRSYELAISGFNTLAEYNDFQLRTRNWDNLIADTPENQWSWESTEARFDFQDTRERISNSENQLPTILTFMVANRLLSGINAFTRARNLNKVPEASISYLNDFGHPVPTLRLSFGLRSHASL